MKTKNKTAMQIFFWFTFAAFLTPSIPHLAYFFHSFEPVTRGAENIWWWGVCYAIAISIDGTIIWLCRTVAVAQREHSTSKGYVGGIWAFILFLTVFSWILNWHYARHNLNVASTDLSGPIAEHIFGLSLQDLDPILASMFPLLAIMFTLMADRVLGEKVQQEQKKSLAELAQEAQEAKQRAELERQILEAQNFALPQSARGLIHMVKDARNELRGEKKDKQTEQLERVLQFFRDTPELLADEHAATTEMMIKDILQIRRSEIARMWRLKAARILAQETMDREVDAQSNPAVVSSDEIDEIIAELDESVAPLEAGNGDEHREGHDGDLFGDEAGENADIIAVGDEDEHEVRQDTEALPIPEFRLGRNLEGRSSSAHSANRRYISFEDAAMLTGYTVATLKRKANEGEIRRHPSDRNRLLSSSIQGLKNPKKLMKTTIFDMEPVTPLPLTVEQE